MSLLFLSQSKRQAAALLRKAGMDNVQITNTIQITRETAENWLYQEMEQGNLPLVFQMVKGDVLEKDSQLLFDELKDLVVAKFIIRQEMDYETAAKTATVILPFILKRMVELMQKNPKFKQWWENVDLRKHLPTKEVIKTKIREVGQTFSGNSSSDNRAFA
ncbi:hypothetical protein [Rufibacter quisquiliarum]|uniref:Putative transcriptional regulator n=1 Tax=Rufibacter quisquiliarum TaxID=1549639 RepID=A0A839GKI6_9BACT|nr:hypothetical protein [Rufibacter quisquiliarum]MBA9077309.1 putative transcriptional regulator [Rufibacter quisquiliarum]